MKVRPYLLLGCLGASLLNAHAQSLVINASAVGQLQHSHAPYLVSTDLQTFTAPTPAVSLRDYNAISLTFNAPAGYAWETQNDYAGSGNDLRCVFSYGSKPADTTNTRRVDYSFDFLPGMANTVNYSQVSAWVSDAGFGFEGGFAFGNQPGGGHLGNVAFTALTITIYAAPGIDPLPLENFTQAQMGFEMIGPPYADPGPHTFLVPVPEPSTISLAALGIGVFVLRMKKARPVTEAR